MEFVRKYNRAAIAGMVSNPSLGSLSFCCHLDVDLSTRPRRYTSEGYNNLYCLRLPHDDWYVLADKTLVIQRHCSVWLTLVIRASAIALVAYLDITTEDGDPRVRLTIDDLTSAFPKGGGVQSAPTGNIGDEEADGAQ